MFISLYVTLVITRGVDRNFLRGVRDICSWRLANSEHSAQNCAEIDSVDLFFEDRQSTALDFRECRLQLQSWQPTITFHNFLMGGREDDFPQTIAEIDILLCLRGGTHIGAPHHACAVGYNINHNLRKLSCYLCERSM